MAHGINNSPLQQSIITHYVCIFQGSPINSMIVLMTQ